MRSSKTILSTLSSLVSGVIIVLMVFALVLALLWTLMPETPEWKLVGAHASAVLGLCAGGFVVAWLSRSSGWFIPGTFGLFIGGLSVLYILGPTWGVIFYAAASVLSALFGALIFQMVSHKGKPQSGLESL